MEDGNPHVPAYCPAQSTRYGLVLLALGSRQPVIVGYNKSAQQLQYEWQVLPGVALPASLQI